jgi:hypothetical protein
MEAIVAYRFGGGSTIYQGNEKYALRDFTQQFFRAELKGNNYFVRAYQTLTDAGDSYNLAALGGFMNETIVPTAPPTAGARSWAGDYAQTYVLALQGYIPSVPAGNVDAAHAAARANADRDRPLPGTDEFNELARRVRDNFFQKTPTNGARGGASFIDDSKLRHVEFNYKFFNEIKWAEIQLGGNYRQYDLFSDGTIFNEGPDDGLTFSRIKIDEYGIYTQIAKSIGDLKLTGSIRYDKNENFDGQVTPRLSAVYSIDNNNNIRASFQTGFRNPDTQAQFIYFPATGGTLLGSTEANAARYGVHNGGAWTRASYNAFRAAGGTLNADGSVNGNASLLVEANIPYVQPEKLSAYEIGY